MISHRFSQIMDTDLHRQNIPEFNIQHSTFNIQHSTFNINIMEPTLFSHSQIMNFNDKVDYSAEGIVSKRVIQKEKGNITLFAFDKGQKLSEHSAPFDAMVQVLEGKAEIQINRVPFEVAAGQSIIMPANIPHAVNAVEKFKMLLTMIKE
jgi:quercetin dioxygenase-like cupin family protein